MPDAKVEPVLPDGWSRGRGYSHAVAYTGKTIRVAGQLAVENGKGPVADGLPMGRQFALALANVVACVKAGGGSADAIVNLRVFVTDIKAFNGAGKDIAAAWGEHMGKFFPAMTVVEVTGLVDPNAVIEIEGEAVVS